MILCTRIRKLAKILREEGNVMIITNQGVGHFNEGLNNQDFGFESSRALVILDGCSGAKYPEVGTRLFAQIFQRKEDWENVDKFETNVKETFDDIIKLTERNFDKGNDKEIFIKDNMLFTIIACFKTEKSYIVKIFGDGYVITKNASGIISYIKFHYGECPPYYAYKYCKSIKPILKDFVTIVFERKNIPKIAIATDGIRPFELGKVKGKDEDLINGISVSIKEVIMQNNFFDDTTIATF